jgi:glycine dehydrogenase
VAFIQSAQGNTSFEMKIHTDFSSRHLGVVGQDRQAMLESLGYAEMEPLISDAVPAVIRDQHVMNLPEALSETDALARLKSVMGQNQVKKSFIGQGYYGTYTPHVILRNILENPGWYTAYTPYQAEIAQGRLEALLNFQTMITNLTRSRAMPRAR